MLNKLKPNGAETLAKALKKEGVKIAFGIPGIHNLVLFEALRRSKIRVVPATHESGAGFMANGVGRATGKPGVCILVPGPGLTNAMTPLAEAFVDSVPLLAIVTDVPQSDKRFQMHQIEQTSLAQPIVKSVYNVRKVSDIPTMFQAALNETILDEPGPCILQIPSNLLWERIDEKPGSKKPIRPATVPAEKIKEIAARLKSARRVGMIVGLGAAEAKQELRTLADWLAAPVASTGSGRGVIDEAHPLSLGFGWAAGGIDSVNRILESCDLVVAIGVKFSQTGAHDFHLKIKRPLIHVDASPAIIGKNYQTELSLVMDAREFLAELLKHKETFGPRRDDDLVRSIRKEKESRKTTQKQDKSVLLKIGNVEYTPWEFYGALRSYLPSDSILVTDAGLNERLTLQHWVVHEPRTLLNPSDYESMGYAIPSALGAALALPKRQVVVIVGDGGLVMSGLELMTAVREKVNLTVVVLNNNGYGVIKKIQEETFGASIAVDTGAPNFEALTKSIRLAYQDPSGGLDALKQAVHNPGPTLLEVNMRYAEQNQRSMYKKKLKNGVKQILQKFL
ncbi:MAG: thiamine pyrophosphate-binding protein [Anaerolineales bacterium]|nr:thiamine pyrophosphate-binding protein [Anaerolineales bacterium]